MTDKANTSDGRPIKLRYPGTCAACGKAIPKGETALHFASSKTVRCMTCQPAATGLPATRFESQPGASAQREYERRVRSRKDELTERWGGRLGGAIAWWEDDKQSTRSWSKGARGENELAEYLETKLADSECILLHDRKKPKSRANIDHLIIGPAGVTVLDAKNYSGKARTERVGFGKKRRTLLRVAGRDKTSLIDGLKSQIEVVRTVVEAIEPPIVVPVRGALCWWNSDGLPLLGQLEVDGIPVLSPRDSSKLAGEAGPLFGDAIRVVAERLATALPPA